jgi:signal transduction histidine kinase
VSGLVVGRGSTRLLLVRGLLVMLALVLTAAYFELSRTSELPAIPVWGRVLFVSTGLVYVGTGIVCWQQPGGLARTGLLLAVAGDVWLLYGLKRSSSDLVYSVAVSMQGLWLPVVVQVVLGYPAGRLRSRLDRRLVAWTYTVAAVSQIGDVGTGRVVDTCSTTCPRFLFVTAPTWAGAWGRVDLVLQLGTAAVLIAVLAWRLVRTPDPARRTALPVVVGSLGLGGWFVTNQFGWQAVWLFDVAPMVLPVAILLSRRVQGGDERAVGAWAVGLDPSGSGQDLQVQLRHILHDPSLILLRPAPTGGWVNLAGEPSTAEDPDQLLSVLGDSKAPVGALRHHRSLLEQPQLLGAVLSVTALCLTNESLSRELVGRIADVEDAQRRIITAADEARGQVERNLHDGAQQRLLAASLTLQRTLHNMDPASTVDREELAGVQIQIGEAIAELRALSRGMRPPLLAEAGLVPAVRALVQRCPVPCSLTVDVSTRLAPDLEATAYYVAAEAVTNATKHARAASIRVSLQVQDDELLVQVSDDGVGGAVIGSGSGLSGLADRVRAVRGELMVTSVPDHGTTVAARLPITARHVT